MSKTAKKKEPKADESGAAPSPVVPPEGFERSGDLRIIDGVLHQRYIPHANIGGDAEHWQAVEEWETDSKTGETSQVDP